MSDVFISYSRQDEAFASRLEAALLATDPPQTVWRDKSGLGPGVKWRPEVQEGIATANNFVFVISPESVHDTISGQLPPGVSLRPCGFEIDHAVSLGKRIVPVMLQYTPSATLHPSVRECNYIDFREAANFEQSFTKLLVALHTDTEWVHAHTRLHNRASEWLEQNRDRSFLLGGKDLTGAEQWLAQPVETHANLEATPLETEYIAASRAEETRSQKRRTRIAYAFGGLMTCLAIYSLYERSASIRQRDAAEQATRHLAAEVVRYSWVDVAHQEDQNQLLNEAAKKLDVHAYDLLPHDSDDLIASGGRSCGTYLTVGFRYLYCSLRDVIGLQKLQSISGYSVLLPGGPHGDDLDWHSKRGFGHYNPEFLSWLEQNMVPLEGGDARTNELIKVAYASQIGPAARALYHTHQILFASPDDAKVFRAHYSAAKGRYVGRDGYYEQSEAEVQPPMDALKNEYLASIAAGKPLQLGEMFRWLSDYAADQDKDDWYMANTAGGFWVRRSVDGTEPQVFRLVTKLLAAYEPGVLEGKPETQR